MIIQQHKRVSGLSGNEIFCLSKLNMKPGQLCVGNSVVAIGLARGIGAGLSTLGGGEVTEVTSLRSLDATFGLDQEAIKAAKQ